MEEWEPDRQPRCECNFKRRSWDDVLDEEGSALLNILEFPSKVGLHSLPVLLDVWGEFPSKVGLHSLPVLLDVWGEFPSKVGLHSLPVLLDVWGEFPSKVGLHSLPVLLDVWGEFPSKVGLHSLPVLVDVGGELASHKRSHYPSSQGWAFRSPLLYNICLFVWSMVGWVTLPLFSSVIIKLVCYMYIHVCTCVSMHTLLTYCIIMCE